MPLHCIITILLKFVVSKFETEACFNRINK